MHGRKTMRFLVGVFLVIGCWHVLERYDML